MLNILQTLKAENKKNYIMGDFDINLLNYDHNAETRYYVDTMYSNAFLPLITKPTRITPTSATLIANIYSNNISGEKFLLTKLNNNNNPKDDTIIKTTR